jgi:hypothetical protein
VLLVLLDWLVLRSLVDTLVCDSSSSSGWSELIVARIIFTASPFTSSSPAVPTIATLMGWPFSLYRI